jgi:surface antigen
MRGRRIRLPAIAAAMALALCGGGCSFQLGSMFDHSNDRAQDLRKQESTGSIGRRSSGPVATAGTSNADKAPHADKAPQADASLRAAARELVARNYTTTSLPWENPQTGARGTVTPLAKAYTQAGLTCRDFLASYIQDGAESWLQGEACRGEGGGWEVRSLRPWTSS